MLKSVWFMMLFVINADGTGTAVVRPSLKPEWNNEISCLENSKKVADTIQQELDPSKSRVYYYCSEVKMKDIMKLDNGI